MEKIYDVIVIGSGPAGATAALYLARYARSVCVIGKDFGLSGVAGEIENWPGTESISGPELTTKIQEHAKKYGADFIYDEVLDVKKENNLFSVKLSMDLMKSKAIIFANGSEHRKLGVKGEKELVGKGVSYCATCDGMFFKDKKVIVVGGSDAAAKAVLFLSDIAKKVTLIYRKGKMRCEQVYTNRIYDKKNIEFRYNSEIVEILGDEKVEGVRLKDEEILNADGVFIEIGSLPCNILSSKIGVKCNNAGQVIVDKSMKTNIEGVFAAGDLTDSPLKQLITASAEGAIAANSAHEFLQKN